MPTQPQPFYKRSFHPASGQPTINAISPTLADPTEQAERRARHLAVCEELIDLGLQLARRAAARALAADDRAQSTEQPTPKPPSQPDHEATFARLSAGVRHAVALEARIASNAFAPRPQNARSTWSTPAAEPTPERPDYDSFNFPEPAECPPYNPLDEWNLYEAVGNLAMPLPNYPEIIETLTETIQQTLTAHPDDHLSENFARICKTYDIEPDRHQLQPHLESQLRPSPDAPDRYPKPK